MLYIRPYVGITHYFLLLQIFRAFIYSVIRLSALYIKIIVEVSITINILNFWFIMFFLINLYVDILVNIIKYMY